MKLLHTLYKLLHRVKWVHLQVKKCGPISCVFVTILLLVFSLITAAFIIWYHISQKNVLTLYIDCEGPPLSTVNEKFLSLGLDSSVITDGFKNFNMTNPKLIKMIKHLSPAYLRVGGNLADKLVFVDGNVTFYENKYFQYNETLNYPENYTLKASDWLKLNELVRNAQMDMIFDLNSLLRFKNGSWNYENGKRLIQYSHDHELMLHWELGNEPNSYPHKFDTSVNATQLGRDYGTLKELLNQYEMYKNSYLVGPSTTRLRNKEIAHYFGDFLKSGARAINAITWHHYYFAGYNATPAEFLDPKVFNYLKLHISRVKNIVSGLNMTNIPVWLGETASAWGGGAPNLSDKFISSFIWLDKLGLSAKMGLKLVIRQSIFKDHYALLNDTYDPNPDWWLSIIYKKIVGINVVVTKSRGDKKIRLYAHCAKNDLVWSNVTSKATLVVFGVNLNDAQATVNIEELRCDSKVYVFEVTSDGSSLYSQKIRLNGDILTLLPNYELPKLKPRVIQRSEHLNMPPYSIVFWIFTNSNVKACTI